MNHQVILDLSRLVSSVFRGVPAGVPRVELAYAQHFVLNAPYSVKFVVDDAFGRIRALDSRLAMKFIAKLALHWQQGVVSRRSHLRLIFDALFIHVCLLVLPRRSLARAVSDYVGQSLYFIVSQLHLERPESIRRLKKRKQLRLIYFVHDIIPCAFPEYFPKREEAINRVRMATAAELADTIIVNSQATADSFLREFAESRLRNSIVVAPLGVSLPVPQPPPVGHDDVPYFVMVGTIEPRKNHLLILNIWRNLSAALGSRAPRLVIIGARGWENENIVDMLERCRALRGIVEERGKVSDAELVQILVGARALLMPSFIEGYGLPVVEALACGVPVLCSDIPAFREVGGRVPEYLDPIDGVAWRAAILDYMSAHSSRREEQEQRLADWQIPTWGAHFRAVFEALGLPE